MVYPDLDGDEDVVAGPIPSTLALQSYGPPGAVHYAVGYRVSTSPDLRARWAEVVCRCGVVTREVWTRHTETYASLVRVAWALSLCVQHRWRL